MDAITAMTTRRSIRKYTSDPVKPEDLEAILNCGRLAPTGVNRQAWKFIVATDQKVTLANAFEIADDVLRQAVVSISDLIKNTGFINLDFADVTCVMKDAGFAHMGVGRAAGKGKAEDAARMAVASPLMETSINGARGVLINITGSEDTKRSKLPEIRYTEFTSG